VKFSSFGRSNFQLQRHRHSIGFTLFELLITVAIASMVLISAYACLQAGLVTRKEMESRAETLQSGRVALNWMVRDLRSSAPLSVESEFVGLSRMIESIEADNIDFATRYHKPATPGETGFRETSYFLGISETTETLSLWRRTDSYRDPEPLSGGLIEEIVRNVQGLKLEYYDGIEWFDDWGSAEPQPLDATSLLLNSNLSGMPEAVRITLKLAVNLKKNSSSSSSSSSASSTSSLNSTGESSVDPADDGDSMTFQTIVRLIKTSVESEDASGSGSTGAGNNFNPTRS
jgi:type II secretion system protein J